MCLMRSSSFPQKQNIPQPLPFLSGLPQRLTVADRRRTNSWKQPLWIKTYQKNTQVVHKLIRRLRLEKGAAWHPPRPLECSTGRRPTPGSSVQRWWGWDQIVPVLCAHVLTALSHCSQQEGNWGLNWIQTEEGKYILGKVRNTNQGFLSPVKETSTYYLSLKYQEIPIFFMKVPEKASSTFSGGSGVIQSGTNKVWLTRRLLRCSWPSCS